MDSVLSPSLNHVPSVIIHTKVYIMELQKILSSQTISREDRQYVLTTFKTQALLRHNPPQENLTNMDTDLSSSLPGLSPISENDTPTKRDRKLSLLSRVSKFRHAQSPIEAPIEKPADDKVYFGHSWNFWHDKHAASGDYEGRLTLMQEDINNVKLFWEVINSFPFERLGYKDSVHFFKKGVKPVWEDPRNVNGGAWNFRVPKEKTDEFWKELLVLAVGEHFHDVLQNVPNVPQGVPKRKPSQTAPEIIPQTHHLHPPNRRRHLRPLPLHPLRRQPNKHLAPRRHQREKRRRYQNRCAGENIPAVDTTVKSYLS